MLIGVGCALWSSLPDENARISPYAFPFIHYMYRILFSEPPEDGRPDVIMRKQEHVTHAGL